MLIIPFLILLIIFGFEITFVLKINADTSERFAISYLLGIGLFTFLVFFIDWVFNINYSLNNTFSLLTTVDIFLFAIQKKETIIFFKSIKIIHKKPKFSSFLFWGFLFLVFVFTLIVNLYWPISDWDALALYDFRAKVFMVDQNLTHAALNNGYFIQYPLLTSLAHLFVYQMGLPNPKFIYSLFYLSFVLVFYNSLRRQIGESKAMFFTALFSTIPQFFTHSMMAYTNLPYISYLCSGVFYLYEWIKDKRISTLLLSGVLVGLSCWVRITEPFWWIPLFVVVIVTLKNKRWKEILYYFIPVYFFYKTWKTFMLFIGSQLAPQTATVSVVSNPVSPYLSILRKVTLGRVVEVITYLYRYVFSSWGLIFLVFIIVCIYAFKPGNTKKSNRSFFYITFLFLVFLFVGTLGFSIINPTWSEIPDSASRMAMIFYPLFVYNIGLNLNDKKDN